MRRAAIRWLPVSLRPVRLPLTLVKEVDVEIEVDVDDLTKRRLLRLEQWLRRRVVGRLPGGKEKEQ